MLSSLWQSSQWDESLRWNNRTDLPSITGRVVGAAASAFVVEMSWAERGGANLARVHFPLSGDIVLFKARRDGARVVMVGGREEAGEPSRDTWHSAFVIFGVKLKLARSSS